MNARWRRCSRSLSERGVTASQVLSGIALLIVLVVIVMKSCRSREDRLWEFVDGARDALVAGRDAEVMSAFDPSVVYQRNQGFAQVQRDYKLFQSTGIRDVKIQMREATMSGDGADVRMEV